MKTRLLLLATALMLTLNITAQTNVRESILLDKGWKFAFGHAADPKKDFGCGTEYFNYLTKANSIHNEGPYAMKFNDADWQEVSIPHDWATTLPYAPEASHSHGYKTVGYKYPETSVGWYRKVINIPASDGQAYLPEVRWHLPQCTRVVQRLLYGHGAQRLCHPNIRCN